MLVGVFSTFDLEDNVLKRLRCYSLILRKDYMYISHRVKKREGCIKQRENTKAIIF